MALLKNLWVHANMEIFLPKGNLFIINKAHNSNVENQMGRYNYIGWIKKTSTNYSGSFPVYFY